MKHDYFNINYEVKVKLTEYGRELYYHQFDDLIKQGMLMTPIQPKVDKEGYTTFQLWELMSIYGPHIYMGMTKLPFQDNAIYIPKEESINMTSQTTKEFTYTDAVYEFVKDECEGMDSIYEDYIVKLVGNFGLAALKRANLIESCGVLNCRRLWVLCERNKDKSK